MEPVLNALLGVFIAFLVLAVQGSAQAIVRSVPGKSAGETIHMIRRAFDEAEIWKRQEDFRGSSDFNTSLNNMLLFTFDLAAIELSESPDGDTVAEADVGIEVWCETCYVKGIISASLTTQGDLLETIDDVVEEVKDETKEFFHNITEYARDLIESSEGIFNGSHSISSWESPAFDLDFNVQIPEVPGYMLQFGFDELEVYSSLQIVVKAGVTYEFNLWKSGPKALTDWLKWDLDSNISLDIGLSVDLILSVEQDVSISTGFHLKLDDGAQFKIALFSEEASEAVLQGGRFEFLPVTVEAGGVRYNAVLRLSAIAGIEMKRYGIGKYVAGAGVFAGIHANLVELSGEITTGASEESDCAFYMDATYQVGLGAAVGAYVFVQDNFYSAVAESDIPIWGTRVGEMCVTSGSVLQRRSLPTATRELHARQGMVTTTTETEVTYTGTQCLSTGLTECPPALQTIRKVSQTETLTRVVESGADVDWDEPQVITAIETRPFGDSIHEIPATSGAPTPFTITGSGDHAKDSDDRGGIDGKTGGVSNKVIIGVSVGVGVLFLTLLGALIFNRIRRRSLVKTSPSPMAETVVHTRASKGGTYDYTGREDMRPMQEAASPFK